MTADELRKKDRNEMKKENTHPVKVCRFVATSHAQNRMVGRGIRNETMIENLCRKPAAKSKVRFSSKGPSYLRMNSYKSCKQECDYNTPYQAQRGPQIRI